MGRFFRMVLLAMLVTAMASTSALAAKQRGKLEQVQNAYAASIRWGDFENAWQAVDPAYREERGNRLLASLLSRSVCRRYRRRRGPVRFKQLSDGQPGAAAPGAVIHPDENGARRLIHCITGRYNCPQLVSRGHTSPHALGWCIPFGR